MFKPGDKVIYLYKDYGHKQFNKKVLTLREPFDVTKHYWIIESVLHFAFSSDCFIIANKINILLYGE